MADEKQQQILKDVEGHIHENHHINHEQLVDQELWGKAFRWEIRGVPSVEEVWRITGDFVRVDAWVTSLVQSCELAAGQANQAGCVRKPTLFPSGSGQPPTSALEKLLFIDPPAHTLQYTILPGATLPGFSLMDSYVSTLSLSTSPSCASPLPHDDDDHHHPHHHDHCLHHDQADHHHDAAAVADAEHQDFSPASIIQLHWSFTCKPTAALTQEQAIHTAFSLYNTAVNDLKTHLSLPDGSVTLLD